jgi:hypothetical protein
LTSPPCGATVENMRRAVLLLALVAAAAAGARAATPSHGQPSPRALEQLRMAQQCVGQQRWPIKTLADPEWSKVNLKPAKIVEIPVKQLRLMEKPKGASTKTRIRPVEVTVYEVKAALIEARWIWDRTESVPAKKGDRDIHLVIADPVNHALTMIVEFPDPACVDSKAPAIKR